MKRIDFNTDWKFRRSGMDWTPVTLPHDAQISDERVSDAPGGSGHGYFVGNVYEYEKRFMADETFEGGHAELLFEGIYKNATVCLNGKELITHKYGYTPFTVDLTDQLIYGEENVITVTADNSKLPNSRWYTGGGIYRPVTLLLSGKDYIPLYGVKIKTLSIKPARILVETTTASKAEIKVEILDQGQVIAASEGAKAEIEIPDGRLWDETNPYLYEAKVSLVKNDTILDETIEKFGIREITYSPAGFFVNGKNTLLKGGCVHHDNGIIGAASFEESEWRRVKILKEHGFNAIRSSHNPASRFMLEACDHYGMYVMDEAFDMWYLRKTKYDYGMDFNQCWKDDVKSMVERDFNHPSVVMYSIGNEVSEPGKPDGVRQGKEIIRFIKRMDKTRPVTAGMNLMLMSKYAKGKGQYDNVDAEQKAAKKETSEVKNASLIFNTMASFIGPGMNKAGNSDKVDKLTSHMLDALDIAGYNYANGRYPMEGTKHPDRIVVGSETFPYEIGKNWDMVKKYPYLIGDFMWTSWDYLGEAGLGAWSYTGGMPFNRPYPWLLGGAGVIDILGNPDASCGLAEVVWGNKKEPVIGVRPVNHPKVKVSKSVWRGTNAIPSWSWQNCDGNKAEIDVFADAASVELFINGKSVGKKKIKEYKAFFKTKYAKGEIKAVAFDENGKEISSSMLKSATGAIKVCVEQEENSSTNKEIAYFNICIAGENGVVESNADRKLKFVVTGGELLGSGSANPCTKDRYHTGECTTYQGRAQAIVRITDEHNFNIQVIEE